MSDQKIFEIKGKIFSSPYDWGGDKLIPGALGFAPEPGVPYAEYWIGVHKKAPAKLIRQDGTEMLLEDLIKQNPEAILGKNTAQKFSEFPFLFKLLEAKEMLSIQVHPTKQQAIEGFTKENEQHIPLDDPKRTYKDTNAKFEYALALDTFWLLHGFRQPEDLKNVLASREEFKILTYTFADGNYEKLYRYVMNDMSDAEANTILGKLAAKVLPEFEAGKLEKSSPDYWTAKAIKYMDMKDSAYDRGIFSIYLLNLVQLKKGQGIFQDTGTLHAYLEGPIIEVMTNSDNVARGGITPKYIDREELLKMVNFAGVTPYIVEGKKEPASERFETSNDVFIIDKIEPEREEKYTATSLSPEILMCLGGTGNVTTEGNNYELTKGKSYFITASTKYEITGEESLALYKTSVPQS